MKDELRKIKQHPMFSNLMMEYRHRGMTDEVSQYLVTILNDHHMIRDLRLTFTSKVTGQLRLVVPYTELMTDDYLRAWRLLGFTYDKVKVDGLIIFY